MVSVCRCDRSFLWHCARPCRRRFGSGPSQHVKKLDNDGRCVLLYVWFLLPLLHAHLGSSTSALELSTWQSHFLPQDSPFLLPFGPSTLFALRSNFGGVRWVLLVRIGNHFLLRVSTSKMEQSWAQRLPVLARVACLSRLTLQVSMQSKLMDRAGHITKSIPCNFTNTDQEPEKQTATLTAKNPERVTHGPCSYYLGHMSMQY